MNILEFDNHLLSAIIYIQESKRFIELSFAWEKSLIFSVHWDLKLIAILITKRTN